MNFMRGQQMIIHDPTLNNQNTTPPTPLRPPAAKQVWTVTSSDTPEHIIGWAAVAANGFDALHFMAHGNKSWIKIGSSGFSWANVDLFSKLKGKIRCITFFSCMVGSDEASHKGHSPIYGSKVADLTGAKVVAARQPQIYSWNASNVIDFGDFEGEVYVFSPGGSYSVYNSYNPFREQPKLNLETIIFN